MDNAGSDTAELLRYDATYGSDGALFKEVLGFKKLDCSIVAEVRVSVGESTSSETRCLNDKGLSCTDPMSACSAVDNGSRLLGTLERGFC